MKPFPLSWFAVGLAAILSAPAENTVRAAEPTAEQLEFFEKQVRPILARRCYECHGPDAKAAKGGLRLDSRAAAIKGGDTGPAVVPGDVKQSLLVGAINYGDLFQMPPKSKLPAGEIAALTKWITEGAAWPTENPPPPAPVGPGFDLIARRDAHWAWKPLSAPALPEVQRADWVRDPLDRFLLAKLETAGLTPAAEAERSAWLRRVSFALVGLPPTPEDVAAFLADRSPQAHEAVVDRLLATPQFGERWARHWLDLVRYAETRGHEFDYPVPNAWQYRDYVIRAYNADVPFEQFSIEHLAGDLLPQPRTNPQTGANESILAPGFWFLGEWVHSPVDIRQDECDRFDNMVDTFGKAFLGLTIGCARCHEHKFDALTQHDYYALSGFLQSSGYRLAPFESVEKNRQIAKELAAHRQAARAALLPAVAESQRAGLAQAAEYLRAAVAARKSLAAAPAENGNAAGDAPLFDFEDGAYDGWTVTGTAFGDRPQTRETIAGYQGDVAAQGKYFVNSHNIRGGGDVAKGDGHVGTLTSPKFKITHQYLRLLVGGGAHAGKTCVNLLVDGKVVGSLAGKNNNRMEPRWLIVGGFRGREAQLQAVDEHQQSWGNIGFDHVVQTNAGPTTEPSANVARTLTPAERERLAPFAAERKLNVETLAAWMAQLDASRGDPRDPLHLFAQLADAPDGEFAARWKQAAEPLRAKAEERLALEQKALDGLQVVFDPRQADPRTFLPDGFAFGDRMTRPGDVRFSTDPRQPLAQVFATAAVRRDPAWKGAWQGMGDRDPGRLGGMLAAGRSVRTPTFALSQGTVWYLVQGAGRAYAAVDSHAMINGPLHGQIVLDFKDDSPGRPRWVQHNLSAYVGHEVHVEFTADDQSELAVFLAVEGSPGPGTPHGAAPAPLRKLYEAAPADRAAAAELTATLLREASAQLARGLPLNEAETASWAELAEWLAARPDLSSPPRGPEREALAALAAPWLAKEAELAAGIQRKSALAMTMWDGSAQDERLLIRGNSKTPGPPVPRRFLEALEGQKLALPPSGSGRLELARWIADPAKNPFLSRVYVNRLWHHLFGRGIVASTDNFGVLGQTPTHPELLDHLATRFVADGWSTKRLLRSIVLSSAFRMSSVPSANPAKIEAADPANRLLHRMPLHRLEAEAIRDAVLTVSGRLDRASFGPSVAVHLTPFMEGRGRPGGGPLDGAGRRSVYLSVRRNFLSPLMLAYDFPIPFAARGQRNVSNVPAQALILMNDPLVVEQAGLWGKQIAARSDLDATQRIERMYLSAFARPPQPAERAEALAFLADQAREHGLPADQWERDPRPWADLGHVLFNVKEFIFLP